MEEFSKHTAAFSILMTTDTVGGVWCYSMELCKALLQTNVQVYLVTSGAPLQPSQKREAEGLVNVTIYETDFKLEWMEHPWQSIKDAGKWLLQLEEELQPDLIHLNCYSYGSLSWKAPVVVVAHSDVWSWWLAVKNEQPPGSWNEYFQRVQAGLRNASFIIAPSKTMMKYIRTIYSVTTPGTVIYNARDTEIFKPANKEDTVFSMGRIWDEAKNIQLLVDASSRIDYQIKLAGDNSFDTKTCVATGTNITYLGKLPASAIAHELSTASVYVLPARYEPFGLTVLEAALSGCALVLGNIDSLRELWNDSAIYVDTNNVNALAGTINQLVQNKNLRRQYAERAMRQAKKYTISGWIKNYHRIYNQLLHQNIYHKQTL